MYKYTFFYSWIQSEIRCLQSLYRIWYVRISEKESGSQADFIGMNATVTERIFAKGFGRISFVYEGNSISEPARSENGEEIPTGTSVVVLEVRDKVYIVQPLQ